MDDQQPDPLEDSIDLISMIDDEAHAHKRFHIFLGKGGVGKTTMAYSKALKDAKAGKKTLLVNIMSTEVQDKDKEDIVKISDDLELYRLEVNPPKVMDELLEKSKGVGGLALGLIRMTDLYKSMVRDAPGLPEFTTFYSIYDVFFHQDYDSIVFDSASTGHGVSFLEAPKTLNKILVGNLRGMVHEIFTLLQDRKKTRINVVTLPEEMPVSETVHLVSKIQENGLDPRYLIVNRVYDPVLKSDETRQAFAELRDDAGYLDDFREGLRKEGYDTGFLDSITLRTYSLDQTAAENSHYVKELESKISAEEILHIPLIEEPEKREPIITKKFEGCGI